MRCVVLARFLASVPAEAAIEVLASVIAQAGTHANPDYLAAAECLTATLSDADLLPYASRATLYAAAKRAGHTEVSRLFFDASPSLAVAATGATIERQDPLAPERQVVPRGRALTLGERKSLARSHRRDLIQHLVRDPHPDVVRILVDNPHLTEADVVAIAARRPALPESLAILAASSRWGTRYRVKLALAQNPYTPLHLAIRLLTTLRAMDLRAIADSQHLPVPLREQAKALLARR